MSIPRQVLAAMVALHPTSHKLLAKEVGMSPSNFSAAMSGARAFPEDRIPPLLNMLGVDAGGQLKRSKVHLWVLGRTVGDLRVATSYFLPDGADFGGVWREGQGPYDLARIRDLPLLAISDGRTRIVVRSEVGMFATPEPVNSDTVPVLRRRRGTSHRVSGPKMLSVAGAAFSRWEQGDVTLKEFDTVFNFGDGR